MNMFLEVSREEILKEDFGFIKSSRRTAVSMKNKRLFVLIDGEEVYFKKFILPTGRSENLYILVKGELNYSIGTLKNIIFDYKVVKKNKKNVEVMVYYSNSQKISIINDAVEVLRVKKISLVQLVIFEMHRKYIKDSNYIMAFLYKDDLYFLNIKENELLNNMILKKYIQEKDNFNKSLNTFIEKYKESIAEVKKVFCLNLESYDIKENISSDFEYVSLGNILRENLILSFLR